MSTESFIPYLQICSFRFYVTYSRNYLNLNQGLFGVASFRIKVPSFLFVDIEKQSGHLFPDALLVEPDDVFPATSTGRLKKKKKRKIRIYYIFLAASPNCWKIENHIDFLKVSPIINLGMKISLFCLKSSIYLRGIFFDPNLSGMLLSLDLSAVEKRASLDRKMIICYLIRITW